MHMEFLAKHLQIEDKIGKLGLPTSYRQHYNKKSDLGHDPNEENLNGEMSNSYIKDEFKKDLNNDNISLNREHIKVERKYTDNSYNKDYESDIVED